MKTLSTHYQESGRINIGRLGLGLLILILACLVLGYVYSMLIHFIPLIYFTFFVTVGFGISLAFCFKFTMHLIKNRNEATRYILVLATLFFATYFQWVGFVASVILEGYPNPIEYLNSTMLFLNPVGLFALIGEINTYGTWGIGSAGTPINGAILAIIWLAEIIIIGFPLVMAALNYEVNPYSEKLNKWYDKLTINDDFEAVTTTKTVESNLNEGVLEALLALKPGNAFRHSKVHLHFLEGEDDQYLSIDRVYIETGKNDKVNTTPIVKNYRITPETAQAIKDHFSLKKENLFLA
ncbi:MAG: hypothetical protein AAF598_02855 [Bacteroidota bacterium]